MHSKVFHNICRYFLISEHLGGNLKILTGTWEYLLALFMSVWEWYLTSRWFSLDFCWHESMWRYLKISEDACRYMKVLCIEGYFIRTWEYLLALFTSVWEWYSTNQWFLLVCCWHESMWYPTIPWDSTVGTPWYLLEGGIWQIVSFHLIFVNMKASQGMWGDLMRYEDMWRHSVLQGIWREMEIF